MIDDFRQATAASYDAGFGALRRGAGRFASVGGYVLTNLVRCV